MTKPIHASQDARDQFSNCSILEICQAIGLYHLDPPDTTYQHAHLTTLKQILFRKLSDEYRDARDRCVPEVTETSGK